MHYNFAVKWLKAFRESPEAVCKLYDDDFIFEDVMLDQHNITSKPDLHRLFAPYANTDPENGIGIHNFKIRSYLGDERSGLIRWEWSPEHAAAFLGLDVAGKPFGTQGHTFHQYNEKGLITRESSWWDAAAVVRQVGPVSPDKLPAGPPSSLSTASKGGRPSQDSAAGGLPHAQRWCEALGRDTAALGELYADYFTLEFGMVDDHLNDTVTDRQMLSEKLGGLANGDNGRYTFTATEWLGDERYGLIHWNVKIEGAATYRGLPTGGKTLETIGSTFHQFDRDGRILLESTCWEDNRVFEALGLPIVRPHYWTEDFDPASLIPA
jgi:steroid delta-isomerase-like uncharacterized protein